MVERRGRPPLDCSVLDAFAQTITKRVMNSTIPIRYDGNLIQTLFCIIYSKKIDLNKLV